jgi:hypothetical protein
MVLRTAFQLHIFGRIRSEWDEFSDDCVVLYHLHVTLHLRTTWTSPVSPYMPVWHGCGFSTSSKDIQSNLSPIKLEGFHPFISHDVFNFWSNMYETAFIRKKRILQSIITSKVIFYTLATKTIFPKTIILITHSKPQICDLILHYCINPYFTFTAISSLICTSLPISVAAMWKNGLCIDAVKIL